jgi:hypothetical protein
VLLFHPSLQAWAAAEFLDAVIDRVLDFVASSHSSNTA